MEQYFFEASQIICIQTAVQWDYSQYWQVVS